jgi:N-carbamoylputrescine amidase
MLVTVVDLDGRPAALEAAWPELARHVREQGSRLLLLPEMPFSPWLAATGQPDPARWAEAVASHDAWIVRLPELGDIVVAASRPIIDAGKRYNEGFVWDAAHGYRPVHRKTYLPDEPGFREATWYDRGPTTFTPVDTPAGRIGFLICTEMWFLDRARAYGKAAAEIIVTPRATEARPVNAERWRAGGRVAAFVSGCFHLSSGHTADDGGLQMGGGSWVVDPRSRVLAMTTPEEPFVTVDIDLDQARKAKSAYPLYVDDAPLS